MKNTKKTHWFRNTICILIACAIIGLILSVVLFAKDNNRTYVTTNLSFTFDGAQSGLAPNGYAFDANELTSEKVLSMALESAGMSGRYTPEDIQPNLTVQGVYPEDLVSQITRYDSVTGGTPNQTLTLSEYHPTVFSVTLYKDFDPSISRGDLTTLLENIIASYRVVFAQEYSMGSLDGIVSDLLEDYDYFQQLELTQFTLDQAIGYADEMSERDATLRVDGKDFSDLSLQFNSMKSNDLSRLSATMTMNALSKDLNRLQDQYNLEIQDLENQVKIQTQLVENLDVLISVYGKSGIIYLSTSDTFNKVDTKSSKIYDNLVDIRNEVSNGIAALNTQIMNYQNKLEELKGGERKNLVDDVLAAAQEAADNDTVQRVVISEDAAEDALQDAALSATSGDDATGIPDIEVTEESEAYEGILSDATTEQKKGILESGISRLVDKSNAAIETLNAMLGTYNEQEINELSITQSAVRYKAPSILSGTFIVLAVKTVGPICMLGLLLALVLIIISRRKEQKAAAKH